MTNTTSVSIQAPNVLLIGGPGTGKTTSITTIPRCGVPTFVICTEPMGPEMLMESGISCEGTPGETASLHWRYIPPADPSWQILLKNADTIAQMSYEDLTRLKSGVNKSAYRQFHELLLALTDFKCDRCGESFGPVDHFPPTTAFALDSLTGVNIMALDLVAGAKTAKHQGEWGIAMDNEERLIHKLTSATKAMFVLTAHLDREYDEVVQSQQLFAAALGRKLAPRIPRFFSDVVHCVRTNDGWKWSTITQNMDLKARNLPYSDAIQQDFKLVVGSWLSRIEKAGVQLEVPEEIWQLTLGRKRSA